MARQNDLSLKNILISLIGGFTFTMAVAYSPKIIPPLGETSILKNRKSSVLGDSTERMGKKILIPILAYNGSGKLATAEISGLNKSTLIKIDVNNPDTNTYHPYLVEGDCVVNGNIVGKLNPIQSASETTIDVDYHTLLSTNPIAIILFTDDQGGNEIIACGFYDQPVTLTFR